MFQYLKSIEQRLQIYLGLISLVISKKFSQGVTKL